MVATRNTIKYNIGRHIAERESWDIVPTKWHRKIKLLIHMIIFLVNDSEICQSEIQPKIVVLT